MATFQVTQQKCNACNKTVYLIDKLTADNRVFHKACFRCHHCKGTLKLSNYNSFEGVLYCRPHFDQLLKRTGSLEKSFEAYEQSAILSGTPKIVKPERQKENEVTVNGTIYHKSCFKCTHGGCTISPSNYIAHEGKLYCKHHHIQLFRVKGNYSQLETTDDEKQQNVMSDKVVSMENASESLIKTQFEEMQQTMS
ncbi:hypothetical protein V6N13_149498 [Hibiscus sabdariffa]